MGSLSGNFCLPAEVIGQKYVFLSCYAVQITDQQQLVRIVLLCFVILQGSLLFFNYQAFYSVRIPFYKRLSVIGLELVGVGCDKVIFTFEDLSKTYHTPITDQFL